MARRTKIAPGIYQDAYGISVIASVGTHPNKHTSPERRFPLGTALPILTAAWHGEKQTLLEALQQRGGPVKRGTLARDVVEYFKTARLSPQRQQERTAQLRWWCVDQGLGSRDRATLTPTELQQAHQYAARMPPPRPAITTARPCRTCSRCSTARTRANPFRDVPRDKEPEAARRDQPYELIQAILAHLRDRGTKGPSRAKAWLQVLAYAPRDVRAARSSCAAATCIGPTGELSAPGRKKGGGTRAQRKTISPEALEAFRAFDAAGCWDAEGQVVAARWGRTARLKAFKLARDKAIAELRQTRPDLDLSRAGEMLVKDLRHSFLTVTLRETGDLAATQLMADHLDPSTTLRYAQGAVTQVLQKAGRRGGRGVREDSALSEASRPGGGCSIRKDAKRKKSPSILPAKVFHPTFPSSARKAVGENGKSRTKTAGGAKASNRGREWTDRTQKLRFRPGFIGAPGQNRTGDLPLRRGDAHTLTVLFAIRYRDFHPRLPSDAWNTHRPVPDVSAYDGGMPAGRVWLNYSDAATTIPAVLSRGVVHSELAEHERDRLLALQAGEPSTREPPCDD